MKNGNPVFGRITSERAFVGDTMTVEGTVNRAGVLLLTLFATALWSYHAGIDAAAPWMIAGLVGGFILAMFTIFIPRISPYTAPFYAAAEGLVLGGVSLMADLKYPGIAIQAIIGTVGVLFAMLILYRSRTIRVTDNFILGVVAATFGVFFFYLASFILMFFGVKVAALTGHGWLAIAISIGICIIAALNLAIDFQQIEEGAQIGAPKYMEWYGAFGLLVTLVWLYMEILRLVEKFKD